MCNNSEKAEQQIQDYGLVSIIMPNYNSERFLHETINSVLDQTYKNWELLIVDDCSTDQSVPIIESYANSDPRIRLLLNDQNRGAAHSRNSAISQAKGKWIAFLDSDDVWVKEKLQTQLDFMIKLHIYFCYSKYERIDEETVSLGKTVGGPKVIDKRKMFRYNYVGCSTVMYDAQTVGLVQIDDRVGNGRNDYALWLKVCRICDCYLLPETLTLYRVRKSSLSHGKFLRLFRYHYEMFRISEKMGRIRAVYHTIVNLFYGFFKKISY